jgi:hypothetical protein
MNQVTGDNVCLGRTSSLIENYKKSINVYNGKYRKHGVKGNQDNNHKVK